MYQWYFHKCWTVNYRLDALKNLKGTKPHGNCWGNSKEAWITSFNHSSASACHQTSQKIWSVGSLQAFRGYSPAERECVLFFAVTSHKWALFERNWSSIEDSGYGKEKHRHSRIKKVLAHVSCCFVIGGTGIVFLHSELFNQSQTITKDTTASIYSGFSQH